MSKEAYSAILAGLEDALRQIRCLCDRVLWCQSSRKAGDLDADLDALEEQRCVVERILSKLEGV